MSNANLFRHAFFIVLGIFLFAFGVSRMIEGPVAQLAQTIKAHNDATAEAWR